MAVLLTMAAIPANASATRGIELGFSDPLFGSVDNGTRSFWLNQATRVGADTVKLALSWASVVGAQPDEPRDPADPAYNFTYIDNAVKDAGARGFEVLIGVQGAPVWAEGPNRPPSAAPGTWKPQPAKLGDFFAAVARRYSGSFAGLPSVRDYQVWNEPNLGVYLSPQWVGDGNELFAPSHYKKMLNAAYDGVKSVRGSNRVVTAGLAPYGDRPGKDRTRPLRFWREAFCLKSREKLKRRKNCRGKPTFDVFAHHAINTTGPPTTSARHPDDVTSADLGALIRTLRAAEKQKTVAGVRRHPLWITELWWPSNPPNAEAGVPPAVQARYIEETLYLAWKAHAQKAIQLLIRDGQAASAGAERANASGLYFFNGDPKPAVHAFSFPFVADRGRGEIVRLWGKAPGPGGVLIERKTGSGWAKLKKLAAGRNRVFAGSLNLLGKQRLRAVSGGETSLAWELPPKR